MTAPCPEHIALVTTSYPRTEQDPGGHFVRAEARALERLGHRVTVIAGTGDAFGWPGVAARIRERPWRAAHVAAWAVRARHELAVARPDRIVAHWAIPSAWPIATAGGAPLEVVSHGADVRLLRALPAALRAALTEAIARRAAVWRFVSDRLMLELCAALPSSAARAVERVARVQPATIELDVAGLGGAIARVKGEQRGRRVAVAVGRLVASKAVDRVIDHVAHARAGDLLVVVGDGPERTRLEAHARRRGVDARFVGTVGRAEALTWIGAADVLLHASRAEGLSTVIREAEALGIPVQLVA